jgi:hypothetical protein
MSHDIKYVIKTTCTAGERNQLKRAFAKELFKDDKHLSDEDKNFSKEIIDLKIVRSDWSIHPQALQLKKGDITFRYSYKWDLSGIFNNVINKLPQIDWECELWDEEVGLCYFYQHKNNEDKQWLIKPDYVGFYNDYDDSKCKEWDDYFSNTLN